MCTYRLPSVQPYLYNPGLLKDDITKLVIRINFQYTNRLSIVTIHSPHKLHIGCNIYFFSLLFFVPYLF